MRRLRISARFVSKKGRVHAALFVDEVRDGVPGEQRRERRREGREEALAAGKQAVRREYHVAGHPDDVGSVQSSASTTTPSTPAAFSS